MSAIAGLAPIAGIAAETSLCPTCAGAITCHVPAASRGPIACRIATASIVAIVAGIRVPARCAATVASNANAGVRTVARATPITRRTTDACRGAAAGNPTATGRSAAIAGVSAVTITRLSNARHRAIAG